MLTYILEFISRDSNDFPSLSSDTVTEFGKINLSMRVDSPCPLPASKIYLGVELAKIVYSSLNSCSWNMWWNVSRSGLFLGRMYAVVSQQLDIPQHGASWRKSSKNSLPLTRPGVLGNDLMSSKRSDASM